MSLRPLKFIVQAVVLEEDNGQIKGERSSEPQVFYDPDALKQWLDTFIAELEQKETPIKAA